MMNTILGRGRGGVSVLLAGAGGGGPRCARVGAEAQKKTMTASRIAAVLTVFLSRGEVRFSIRGGVCD